MQITMPKLGLTMTEARLSRWLKTEGEPVRQGEVLFEFESEKATMEYECPVDGVLSQILVAEGTTVPCGTAVAVLQETGVGALPDRGPEREGVLATPAAKRRARELGVRLAGIQGRGPGGRVQLADVEAAAAQARGAATAETPTGATPAATPLAAALAADLGLDLQAVRGTGPAGRITRRDVLAAARERITSTSAALSATPALPSAQPRPAASPYSQVIPLEGTRAHIARHMSSSAFTAPHVTLFTEADATALVMAREQLNAELGGDPKLGYNALFVALVARALRKHPLLNACLIDDEIRHYAHIHVALAVDTERGLLAPVIHHADRLDLLSLQRRIDKLVARALQGKSLPDELTGGTFTITNLGGEDVDGFTPIINQPQAAILGIGRIASRPAVVDGQLAVRQTVVLSLSFDHRIVDGAPAARFLRDVRQLIERPFVLTLPASPPP